MTSVTGAARPLATGAYVVWGVAALALAVGAIWLIREKRSRRGTSVGAVSLLVLALVAAIGGLLAFMARPGAVAQPATGPMPSSTLTPTLSPVPTAPDAPAATGPIQPTQIAETVEIGYEAIGGVEVGDQRGKIEETFGKPAAVVETEWVDGKAATAFSYESGGRDFEILLRDGKVFAYVVRSKGFATFSGVSVGDGLDNLRAAYPTKLVKKSETEYVLAGPRGSSVRFTIDEEKVSRIDGGRLG